jgi:hypothetical protein
VDGRARGGNPSAGGSRAGVTGRTQGGAHPDDASGMRLWIAILLACAAWGYVTWQGRPPAETAAAASGAVPGPGAEPSVSAGPPAAPAAPLWRRVLAWRETEAPDDPVVHCTLAAGTPEDAFLRLSECEARGGRPDDPSWAR